MRKGCPYLVEDKRRAIGCEGAIAGTETQILFTERKDKERHFRAYCCGQHYETCPHYAAIAAEYVGVK